MADNDPNKPLFAGTIPMVRLPRWQSHKQVYADKITEIVKDVVTKPGDTGMRWLLGCGAYVLVMEPLVARGAPVVGDYYVLYDDGYESWSPAKAFEEGYTLLEKGFDIPR